MPTKTTSKEQKKLQRVCILNPQGFVEYPPPLGKTDTGGQTLYILQLAKALGQKNIKVDIVTRQFDGMKAEEDIFDNVKIVRIPCGPKGFVQKEKMYELMPEMMENFMMFCEKKRREYSVIHSHYWDGGYAGLLLAKMLDIPHIHTPHSLGKLKKIEMSIEDLPTHKLKPAYRYHVRIAVEQKIYNKVDAVVVICETSRIQMLQHYLVDFEKLNVIYPGIDTAHFNTKASKADKEIHMPPNTILTISRLVPAKGIDRVIEAFALVRAKHKDANLFIGGGSADMAKSKEEQEMENQIDELIKKHKLEKYVTKIGFVPHDTVLPAYYRKAALFVLGARYEPFGLTTLEAMACGTPPLVTRVAGSREVIIDGLNGFIVDIHDRKSLAAVMIKLLEDKKLQKRISDNAAFTVQEHYSWDKIVMKFITLYKGLM